MTVKQLFGPPGCGKTETLMRHIDDALSQGVRPDQIICVSFSKKAVNEARERAASRFGLTDKDLMFFRTLHSLAFSALGLRRDDVMNPSDYTAVGALVGETLVAGANPDDGMLIPSVDFSKGTKYLAIIDRARYRKVTLEEEWKEHDTYDMHLFKAKQIADQLAEYKSKMGKVDFVDMIEQYIARVPAPQSRLFIVDEAQDLTPLQFDMVRKISAHADNTVTAGDDDQAIHAWNGASAEEFIAFGDERVILTQSYRLPQRVFDVANQVVRRIRDRVDKRYAPTDEEGSVYWHYMLDTLPLDRGSWTVMGRTNYIVKKVASRIKDMGYYYSLKGHAPISRKQAEAIHTWRALCAGEKVPVSRIKDLYELVPKQGDRAVIKRGSAKLLEAADPEGTLTMTELHKEFGLLVAPDLFGEVGRDAFDVLNLGDEMRTYLTRIENSGEDLTKPPRIKLSTFHAMKGGEDERCAVLLDTTRACYESNRQDDEHRAFYVAVTRSQKELHIIEAQGKYRYAL